MAKAGLDYTIKVNIDSSQATKGEKALLNQVRRMNNDLNKQRHNSENLRIIRKKLRDEVRKGNMTAKEAARLLNKERHAHNRLMQRKRAGVKTTRDSTKAIKDETKAYAEQQKRLDAVARQKTRLIAQQQRMRALSSGRNAQIAASAVSGLGMGGAAAGGARFMALGGAAGMGTMAGLGLGYAGIKTAQASFTAAAKLEDGLMSLEVMFGKVKATRLSEEFRQLARETALTTEGIISSAKIWSSYGNTTEGITDRMKRIGDVTFGNAEKMKLLTTALAQVNAQTKLMGQEKLQLVNAGFSLKAVADAAGISMKDFSKEMEKGRITSEHVNQALINLTSEGGLFYKGLEKGATTMNGKLGIMKNAWTELFQTIGQSGKDGVFMPMLDAATGIAKMLDKSLQLANELAGYDPEEATEKNIDANGKEVFDPTHNSRIGIRTDMETTRQDAARRTRGAGFYSKGVDWMSMFFDSGDNPYDRKYYQDAAKRQSEYTQQYGLSRGKYGGVVQDYQDAYNRRYATGAPGGSTGMTGQGHMTTQDGFDYMSTITARQQELDARDAHSKSFNKYKATGMSDEMATLKAKHDAQNLKLTTMQGDMSEADQKAYRNRLEQNQKREIYLQKWKERQMKKKEEHEATIEKAEKDFIEKEKQRSDLKKERDDQLSEKFNLKRKVAQGAQQAGAGFTGGSLEEFQYITEMQKEDRVVTALMKINEEEKAAKKQLEENNRAIQEKHEQDRQLVIDQQSEMITKLDNLVSMSGVN